MQRLTDILFGTISRLFGCGCQEIFGVMGHSTLVAVALLPARSFGMRLTSGLWADPRVAYYAATPSAAALLREVHKTNRKQPRAGWRSGRPKWIWPRTARR
jgi:hypothetical protein